MKEDILHLLHKYDMPIPRYAKYPTVPYGKPEIILDTFSNKIDAMSILKVEGTNVLHEQEEKLFSKSI